MWRLIADQLTHGCSLFTLWLPCAGTLHQSPVLCGSTQALHRAEAWVGQGLEPAGGRLLWAGPIFRGGLLILLLLLRMVPERCLQQAPRSSTTALCVPLVMPTHKGPFLPPTLPTLPAHPRLTTGARGI